MKWAFENREYYMIYVLYKEFNIGIPNFLLYKLPNKNKFTSIQDFINQNESKIGDDEYLQMIFVLFQRSKYKILEEWDGRYGFKLIN